MKEARTRWPDRMIFFERIGIAMPPVVRLSHSLGLERICYTVEEFTEQILKKPLTRKRREEDNGLSEICGRGFPPS